MEINRDVNKHVVITVECAQCHARKQEANHWFVLEVMGNQFIAEPFPKERDLTSCEVPVCGEGCAQKKFGQYLETGSI